MVACHGQKYVKFKLSLISNVAAHDDYDDGDEAGKNEEQMVMMMMVMMMMMMMMMMATKPGRMRSRW